MSSPVQMWKAFTPWWSSMYIPLKVGHPASRASLRSLVSLGSNILTNSKNTIQIKISKDFETGWFVYKTHKIIKIYED